MLTWFVIASFVVAAALALTALEAIRPPERVVDFLFFVLFLLVLLAGAWGVMLMMGTG